MTTPEPNVSASESLRPNLPSTSLNIGWPAPRTTGATRIRYSSMSPSRVNVDARSALPKSARSLPRWPLRRVTSPAASSLTSLEFLHSTFSSVLEKTILGRSFSARASGSVEDGQ
jgi:hypothetical protein